MVVQPSEIPEVIRRASEDLALVDHRAKLAMFAAQIVASAGNQLHVFGHIVGPDRASGVSPWGHGSDEAVAVSVILRIGSQLVSASADLALARARRCWRSAAALGARHARRRAALGRVAMPLSTLRCSAPTKRARTCPPAALRVTRRLATVLGSRVVCLNRRTQFWLTYVRRR